MYLEMEVTMFKKLIALFILFSYLAPLSAMMEGYNTAPSAPDFDADEKISLVSIYRQNEYAAKSTLEDIKKANEAIVAQARLQPFWFLTATVENSPYLSNLNTYLQYAQELKDEIGIKAFNFVSTAINHNCQEAANQLQEQTIKDVYTQLGNAIKKTHCALKNMMPQVSMSAFDENPDYQALITHVQAIEAAVYTLLTSTTTMFDTIAQTCKENNFYVMDVLGAIRAANNNVQKASQYTDLNHTKDVVQHEHITDCAKQLASLLHFVYANVIQHFECILNANLFSRNSEIYNVINTNNLYVICHLENLCDVILKHKLLAANQTESIKHFIKNALVIKNIINKRTIARSQEKDGFNKAIQSQDISKALLKARAYTHLHPDNKQEKGTLHQTLVSKQFEVITTRLMQHANRGFTTDTINEILTDVKRIASDKKLGFAHKKLVSARKNIKENTKECAQADVMKKTAQDLFIKIAQDHFAYQADRAATILEFGKKNQVAFNVLVERNESMKKQAALIPNCIETIDQLEKDGIIVPHSYAKQLLIENAERYQLILEQFNSFINEKNQEAIRKQKSTTSEEPIDYLHI